MFLLFLELPSLLLREAPQVNPASFLSYLERVQRMDSSIYHGYPLTLLLRYGAFIKSVLPAQIMSEENAASSTVGQADTEQDGDDAIIARILGKHNLDPTQWILDETLDELDDNAFITGM